MVRLIESAQNYDFNYLLEKYDYPNYAKYKNNNKILYHNTWIDNVNSIVKNGLKTERSKQLEYSGNMIWCVNISGATGYGGCTVAFKNDLDNSYYEQVNDTDFILYKDIPASNILFIDTWICEESSLKRVSDIKRLVDRLGADRVKATLYKKQDQGIEFCYDIDFLIECAKNA